MAQNGQKIWCLHGQEGEPEGEQAGPMVEAAVVGAGKLSDNLGKGSPLQG